MGCDANDGAHHPHSMTCDCVARIHPHPCTTPRTHTTVLRQARLVHMCRVVNFHYSDMWVWCRHSRDALLNWESLNRSVSSCPRLASIFAHGPSSSHPVCAIKSCAPVTVPSTVSRHCIDSPAPCPLITVCRPSVLRTVHGPQWLPHAEAVAIAMHCSYSRLPRHFTSASTSPHSTTNNYT